MPEFGLPEVFPLLPLDLFQREGGGGGGEPLVARSVRASSLLSPRFIRELGILELLSFSELQLFYVRLALSPHLCTFDEVMGWESDSECRLGYVLDYLSRLISARSAR